MVSPIWNSEYNKSEQLEFKLEKVIGIQKHAVKVRKCKTPTPWLTLLLALGKSRVKQNSC